MEHGLEEQSLTPAMPTVPLLVFQLMMLFCMASMNMGGSDT
jgi:hypothetical protein